MANYQQLKNALVDVIKQNGNNDITGEIMQTTLLSMINSLGANYQFAGIFTPSTSFVPTDENFFYIGGAGSYSNFGATTINVPTGCICIFTYNGSFSSSILYVGGVVDISKLTNNSYASLSQALADVPSFLQVGGIEVMYKDSTSGNYVKYRLMGTNWSVSEYYWQGVDERPNPNSKNLITSKGVSESVNLVKLHKGYYVDNAGSVNSTTILDFSVSELIKITEGVVVYHTKPAGASLVIGAFYDMNFNFISSINASSSTVQNKEITESDIPNDAVYFRANLNTSDGYLYVPSINNINIINELKENIAKLNSPEIELIRYKFINLDNNNLPYIADTSVNTYSVTKFLKIDGVGSGTIRVRPYGGSPYQFAAIYDKELSPIGYLHLSASYDQDYQLSNLPSDVATLGLSNAYYVVFSIDYNHKESIKCIPENSELQGCVKELYQKFDAANIWWDNNDIFNYNKVLLMPKDVVKAMVEAMSMGKITAIYDNDGYPSLMYKVPKMSIGQFNDTLGNLTTPHPAFVVGGTEKNMIYISVFMTCEYDGHLVSWFGLTPSRSRNLSYLKTNISNKGAGWHLETIYERSLLSLITRAFNSPTPHCNNYWGMNRYAKHESVQMANGELAGEDNQENGAQWVNGTQPVEWSHNKNVFGIQDVCGAYHEVLDLVKLVNGKIYLAADNNFAGAESSWVDTGATIDVIDGHVVMSNTYTYSGERADEDFENVLCTSGYDTLSLDVRKKLVLLGISPKLSSEDTEVLLGYKGILQAKGSGTCYMVAGGAEEYSASGLGYYNICYDLMNVSAHNNMGSRLCYIG